MIQENLSTFKKSATAQGNNYTGIFIIGYVYLKEDYKIITVDLSLTKFNKNHRMLSQKQYRKSIF